MLFHHLFQQVVPNLGNDILTDGQYSIEFEVPGVFLLLHVRFWKKDRLCRVYLQRTGRTTGRCAAELRLLSTLLAAISSEADLVCCSGATQNFVQLVDDSPLTTHGVQRPTTFDDIAIKRLMHRDSYSVFGLIDFFSVLHYLVISLGGSLYLEWTLLTPELVKVRTFNKPFVIVS